MNFEFEFVLELFEYVFFNNISLFTIHTQRKVHNRSVTIFSSTMGQYQVWDFTCSDTLTYRYINQTEVDGGAAVELFV